MCCTNDGKRGSVKHGRNGIARWTSDERGGRKWVQILRNFAVGRSHE